MSIFVQQPHKRVRRMSGLGAFAALRGLGDVDMTATTLALQRNLAASRSTPRPVTTPITSVAEMQARATAAASGQMTMGSDGSDSGSSPVGSFTVEGALPGGVAFLLAGALGLLGASFIFGGK